MADQTDLRALILETPTTTLSEALRGDKDGLDRHASKTGGRHDQHRFHIWCALCQGEADTLADAIVEAIPGAAETLAADLEHMTPQTCPAGIHADWAVDSENNHVCPWCQIEQQAKQIDVMAKVLQRGALDVTEPARAHAALQAELDEARSLARFLRLELIEEEGCDDIDQTIREVELDLDNDEPLPDWLTGKEA